MKVSLFPKRIVGWLANPELITLIGMLVVALSIWGFEELADEVIEGEALGFDEKVLLSFREPGDPSDPVGPSWFEEFGRDITALGSVGVLAIVTLIAVGFLILRGSARSAAYVAVAVVGGVTASSLLKGAFDRPRPDLVPHAMEVYTSSFPSGHSMMSAIVFLTLGALLARVQPNRRLKLYWLIVAALLTVVVGTSRVYLGVHWPSDVLAGWSAGAAWATGCWLVMRQLQRRGPLSEDGPVASTSEGG